MEKQQNEWKAGSFELFLQFSMNMQVQLKFMEIYASLLY